MRAALRRRAVHTRWQDLLAQPLDAVMVLTSGDHAPIAIAAAQAGLHVFVEKPMALCQRRTERAMIEAAQTRRRAAHGGHDEAL